MHLLIGLPGSRHCGRISLAAPLLTHGSRLLSRPGRERPL